MRIIVGRLRFDTRIYQRRSLLNITGPVYGALLASIPEVGHVDEVEMAEQACRHHGAAAARGGVGGDELRLLHALEEADFLEVVEAAVAVVFHVDDLPQRLSSDPRTHADARTHARTHAHTHTHIRTHVRTRMHGRTHTHAHNWRSSSSVKQPQARTHAHTHRRTHLAEQLDGRLSAVGLGHGHVKVVDAVPCASVSSSLLSFTGLF